MKYSVEDKVLHSLQKEFKNITYDYHIDDIIDVGIFTVKLEGKELFQFKELSSKVFDVASIDLIEKALYNEIKNLIVTGVQSD